MTRELIEDFTKIVKPFVQKRLLEENFEGMGEQDKTEFGRDFDEILSLAIKGLESSTWIPVTEKLPEDGQSVLFCDIDDDIMIGYHVKGRHATHFSQDGVYEDMKNVRAWQPLPEPYKGGE